MTGEETPRCGLRTWLTWRLWAMETLLLCLLATTGCSFFRTQSHAPAPGKDAGWPAGHGGAPALARPGCHPFPDDPTAFGSFTVAVTDSVLPRHAPVPHNDAERLVFAQFYETLVRVDCAGDLLPGLADRWSCTPDSATWTFTLRPGALFWDGSPVTATAVRASWQRARRNGPAGPGGDPWSWLDPGKASVHALAPDRLAIALPESQGDLPRLLAHPAFSVAALRPGWTWPVGSGPVRLGPAADLPLPDLHCRPNTHHPRRPGWTALTLRVLAAADARDLVDRQWDLLPVHTLQDSLFYAAVPGLVVRRLPPTRTYLLARPATWTSRGLPPAARMVDRTTLRPSITATALEPWEALVVPAGRDAGCPQLFGPVAAPMAARLSWRLSELDLGEGTLVYARKDATARQMAEFIAARSDSPLRLVPLAPAPLNFVMQWMMSGAGIISDRQRYPTGCLQHASLLGTFGWLRPDAPVAPRPVNDSLAAVAGSVGSPPAPAVCLGVAHDWLVCRRDLAGIKLDFDGTPLLEGMGRVGTVDRVSLRQVTP